MNPSSLSESMDVWNSSPHGVSSYASASVSPDYDWEAGPVKVVHVAFHIHL